MRLFIDPTDVWLFRDGRPFTGGEDHRAISLFPPTPYTMQGAIRSAKIAQSGGSFTDPSTWPAEVGKPHDYGALKLRGPFVAKRDESGKVVRYLPVPADVVKVGEKYCALSPLPQNGSPYTMNAPLGPLWLHAHQPITEASGWLAEEELEKYLDGKPFTVTKADDLFTREPRFGVGISSSVKRAEEGMLYQVEFVRLRRGRGLWLEVEGMTLVKEGVLQLGGEMKAARYEEVADEPRLSLGGKASGKFKLYFATPAYFAGGWQPVNGDWSSFFSKPVKFIAAAVLRAQMLGGARVDVVSQRGDFHKPMRPFVPAGSVYFFEAHDEVTVPATITDEGGQIGFGQVFIGRWEYV